MVFNSRVVPVFMLRLRIISGASIITFDVYYYIVIVGSNKIYVFVMV